MASRKEYNFFEAFIRASEYSLKAANILEETLNNFNSANLLKIMEEIHAVEHEADNAKHEMNKALAKAFITPIEREDIMMLAHELDDVTDVIEDVVIRLYMYDVKSIRIYAHEFTEIIVQSCNALHTMLKEFHNFKKSKTLKDTIIEVNRLEEVGDDLYAKAMRDLFTTEKEPVALLAWNEIYEKLEKCCDSCEHIANVVESVVMKNS